MNTYKLVPVTEKDSENRIVLTNLAKMYCYEWSQYTGMDVDEQGRYIFEKYIPSYWEKPERKAFLLRCETEASKINWAGFVLVDKDFFIHKDYDFALAEFFVLYKYRRQGAGRWMANTVFDLFRGKWELGRNPKNITAYHFWNNIISDYTNGNYELVCAAPEHKYIDGTLGDVFAFDNSI